MSRKLLQVFAVAVVLAGLGGAVNLSADGPSLAGRWSLNRAQSQFPRDVGFGMDVVPPDTSGRGDEDTGRAAPVRGYNPRPISEDQARVEQQMIDEVRNPPAILTIAQTETAVTVTNDRGRTQIFHPDGREEFLQFESGPVATIAKWDGPRLVVRFKVQPERELRYMLSRAAATGPLVVQVQFVEHGGRAVVTRIYDPAKSGDPMPGPSLAAAQPATPGLGAGASPLGQAAAGQPAQGAPPAGQGTPPRVYQPGQSYPTPPAGQWQPGAPPGSVPASPDRTGTAPLTGRPGSELRGLTSLGVVVEELSQAANTCGLRQDAIESLVKKGLTDSGLRVATNSDEDTYLYVRIVTTAMTTGFCFSRYDAILYTNAMATPTYTTAPALVQIELLRNGGLAGGGATQHAESVVSSLRQYVLGMAARIHDANK